MTRKRHTWTDKDGVTHLTRASGFVTFCVLDVPSYPAGAMLGWPSPPQRDYTLKPVTCIACLGEENA